MNDVKDRIRDMIEKNKVLLFMKGTKSFPQCGFSNAVVEVLKREGIPFETVNVLADPEIRQGIKEYSNWPTIPQLYVAGKFLGGCDIVTEMHTSGELDKELRAAGVKS
jgi:monothiol glutaredoxin